MARFKERPKYVEAFRIGYDEYPAWFGDPQTNRHIVKVDKTWGTAIIDCGGWDTKAHKGDYIIKMPSGRLDVCSMDKFASNYEIA